MEVETSLTMPGQCAQKFYHNGTDNSPLKSMKQKQVPITNLSSKIHYLILHHVFTVSPLHLHSSKTIYDSCSRKRKSADI